MRGLTGQPKKEGRTYGGLRREIAALSAEELKRIQHAVQTAIRALQQSRPISVPIEIFAQDLSPAEAVVKHLKEHHGLTFSQIARLLNRDQRGIWGSYARAQRKSPARFSMKASSYMIPLSCFHDRSRSILEHVVTHLKNEKKLPVSHICALLKKRPSTVWTAYQRSRRKQHA